MAEAVDLNEAEDGSPEQMDRVIHIKALESTCEVDLKESHSLLGAAKASVFGVVERTFQAMETQSTQCCEDIKQRLKEARLHYARKDDECAPLYEALPSESLFRVEFEDCAEKLTTLLWTHYRLKVAEVTTHNARLQQESTAKRQVSDSASEVVQGYIQQVVEAREAGNYPKALKKALKARTLLPQCQLQSALLCQHIGEVRACFGEWKEAEAELRQGLQLQLSSDSSVILAIQLSNSFLELYHQQGRYEETIQLGEWVVGTWADSGHECELLKAVYFLADAYYSTDEEVKGFALVEKWEDKVKQSSYELLFVRAERLRQQEQWQEAASLYEEGLPLPSNAYLTVYARHMLAHCYQKLKASEPTQQAYEGLLQSYTTHFPHAKATLAFLNDLSCYCTPTQGESLFQQLIQWYSSQFPQSLALACCCWMLGEIYQKTHRLGEADQCFLQADLIFSASFSQTLEYAHCLCAYGNNLKASGQLEQAKEQYRRASQLYLSQLSEYSGLTDCLEWLAEVESAELVEEIYLKAHQSYVADFPHSRHFVTFLLKFGDFYEKRQQYDRAEEKYQTAYQISSQCFPHSRRVINCMKSLAHLYNEMQQREQAEDLYQKVCQTYAANFPLASSYAYSLQSLANCYLDFGNAEAALESYEKACQVFEVHSDFDYCFARCLQQLSKLYEWKGRNQEAKEKLMRAALIFDEIDWYFGVEECKDAIARLSSEQ